MHYHVSKSSITLLTKDDVEVLMFVGTKTFEDTVKRLDKEIVALKAKVATLEKLTARVTKLESLPTRVTKLETLPAKVTKLEKLPEQVSKLETTRRLWPLQDYSTGG